MNLDTLVIRTPEGDDLLSLYRFTAGIFPPDKPVFDRLIRERRPHYTWKPYTLYNGREIVGNVSVFSFRVWYGGAQAEVGGIAGVATPPEYRRKGIARHLMHHVTGVLDRERLPAVLFTSLPDVYSGHGFDAVPQHYRQADAGRFAFPLSAGEIRVVDALSDDDLRAADAVYSRLYAPYDGKIVRDPDYWTMYQMLFNLYPRPRMAFLRRSGPPEGYIRFDVEPDRLLVPELCIHPEDEEATLALFGCASEFARENQRKWITLALPPGHCAWEVLRRRGVPLEPERDPAEPRETFMLRLPVGGDPGTLKGLQWPLSDKF